MAAPYLVFFPQILRAKFQKLTFTSDLLHCNFSVTPLRCGPHNAPAHKQDLKGQAHFCLMVL